MEFELRRIGKKGDVAIEPIMVLVLGITVLALVGFGFYLHYSGKIEFFNMLPGFNRSVEKYEEPQIVAYNIAENRIEWYDGSKWTVLERDKEVTLGEKKVRGGGLESDLKQGYWYDKDKRPMSQELDLKSRPGQTAKVIQFIQSDEEGNGALYNELDIVINTGNNKIYVLRDGEILLISGDGESLVEDTRNPDKVRELEEYYTKWRDSILEKPTGIRYVDVGMEKEKDMVGYYCVDKINERLVVRLNKAVSEGSVCGDRG